MDINELIERASDEEKKEIKKSLENVLKEKFGKNPMENLREDVLEKFFPEVKLGEEEYAALGLALLYVIRWWRYYETLDNILKDEDLQLDEEKRELYQKLKEEFAGFLEKLSNEIKALRKKSLKYRDRVVDYSGIYIEKAGLGKAKEKVIEILKITMNKYKEVFEDVEDKEIHDIKYNALEYLLFKDGKEELVELLKDAIIDELNFIGIKPPEDKIKEYLDGILEDFSDFAGSILSIDDKERLDQLYGIYFSSPIEAIVFLYGILKMADLKKEGKDIKEIKNKIKFMIQDQKFLISYIGKYLGTFGIKEDKIEEIIGVIKGLSNYFGITTFTGDILEITDIKKVNLDDVFSLLGWEKVYIKEPSRSDKGNEGDEEMTGGNMEDLYSKTIVLAYLSVYAIGKKKMNTEDAISSLTRYLMNIIKNTGEDFIKKLQKESGKGANKIYIIDLEKINTYLDQILNKNSKEIEKIINSAINDKTYSVPQVIKKAQGLLKNLKNYHENILQKDENKKNFLRSKIRNLLLYSIAGVLLNLCSTGATETAEEEETPEEELSLDENALENL